MLGKNMCRCCFFPTSWLTWISPEDTIANLKIHRLGFAKDVKRQYHTPSCDFGLGYRNIGQFEAQAIEEVIRQGLK